MIKELSWYIETDRFSNLVTQMDSMLDEYVNALAANSDNAGILRQNLVENISENITSSGLNLPSDPDRYFEEVIFPNHMLNRKAFDELEKSIVKAHMYQKHLWDYMGTMSVYSPISKRALEKDGYNYNDYVPIAYKKSHQDRSPVENIVKDDANAVPIYAYYDGSITQDYNSQKARIHFDSLQDTSGFNWSKKGWDPNFEIQKNEWHGTFNESGEWVEVSKPEEFNKKQSTLILNSADQTNIQVIKNGDSAILYDPYYEFLFTFLTSKLIHDTEGSQINDERVLTTISSIKSAMESLGVNNISSIVRNPYANRLDSDDRKRISHFIDIVEDDDKVIKMYKSIFGDVISDKVEFKTIQEARKTQYDQQYGLKKKQLQQFGEDLSDRFDFVLHNGIKGDDALQAVFSGSARMPLNSKISEDLEFAGLNKTEAEYVLELQVPGDKTADFNRMLFNALANYNVFKKTEYSKMDLIDDVYDKSVNGNPVHREIDIETTLDDIVFSGSKYFENEELTESEKADFAEAKNEVLSQTHSSYRERLAVALENAQKNYPLVKRNMDISPSELIIKTNELFKKQSNVVPNLGISYRSSFHKETAEEKIRLFDTIDVNKFLVKSEAGNVRKRIRDYTMEFSEYREKANTHGNLFSQTDLDTFFKSDLFKGSSLEQDKVSEAIENERLSAQKAIDRSNTNVLRKIPVPQLVNDGSIANSLANGHIDADDDFVNVIGSKSVNSELFNEIAMFYMFLSTSAQNNILAEVNQDSNGAEKKAIKAGDSPSNGAVVKSQESDLDSATDSELNHNVKKKNSRKGKKKAEEMVKTIMPSDSDSLVIINKLAKDFKSDIDLSSQSSKGSNRKNPKNYVERSMGKANSIKVPATSITDIQTVNKIDQMLKDWAISEGFVFYNRNTQQTIYDKNLAIYGFSKKYSTSDYYSYFLDQIQPKISSNKGLDRTEESFLQDVNGQNSSEAEPEYKPTFSAHPDYNKLNKERAEAVKSRKKVQGNKKNNADGGNNGYSDNEIDAIIRSTQRYIEDRKNMDSFVDSCIKDINESKIKAKAERAEKVLASSIISALESIVKK